MPASWHMAAVQMTSTANRSQNLATAVRLVNEAADLGARLVGLPENFAFMGPEEERIAGAEPIQGPSVTALQELARGRSIFVLAGSIAERVPVPGKTANTSVLIADDGSIAAVYRKIHLFDVSIPDGARYAESETVVAGDRTVLASTSLGSIGLSVCYDLRFPELYRALAASGAELLCVPSAFTLYTGKDHWEVLLRARAIENLCYLLAPAQVGQHGVGPQPKAGEGQSPSPAGQRQGRRPQPFGTRRSRGGAPTALLAGRGRSPREQVRQTFGNAMVVDPWGVVLARCPDGEGVCLAPFSRERLEKVRTELPALRHRKL